jgi:hypothetical protein
MFDNQIQISIYINHTLFEILAIKKNSYIFENTNIFIS